MAQRGFRLRTCVSPLSHGKMRASFSCAQVLPLLEHCKRRVPAPHRRFRLRVTAALLSAVLPLAPLCAATAPAAPAAQGQALSFDRDAYILGPGDRLELTFLSASYKELGGIFDLLSDGSTSLPSLGSVVLEGLTVQQANRWLQRLYARTLRRPNLNLRVVNPRPLQVSVVGEVENPGLYSLSAQGESSAVEGIGTSTAGGGGGARLSGLPTVVSAIQKAGGLTLIANLTDVRLQRRMPGDSKQLRETTLDLLALLQRGDKRQNPFLQDGDTIVVAKAASIPSSEVMELAATNLSPQSIRVNLVGEVKRPGQLELPANIPLAQAILAAGGTTDVRANRGDIELVRINRNGTASTQRFRLDFRRGVSSAFNPPLRDGDSVIVYRSVYGVAADAINTVATPLTGLANIASLFYLIYNNRNNNN
ncbi:SLBB domain-containing protein [Cyanobium sp. FGCU-6]|jgi:polysaccharide export outer membrane protein|nr:SLBB domain-containing protein [Cyanobium sp. FGCU6]